MKTYVIASSRSWHKQMAERLEQRTGSRFLFFTGKGTLTQEALKQACPEIVFVPHWSEIIPRTVHENFTCIVFHMTDLPFGRGGSPLQNLIIRGHRKTKISAIRCELGIDSGPVYLKRDLSLDGSADEIFIRCAAVIEDMIVEIIERHPEPIPQTGEPTVFTRRRPAESSINSLKTISELFDFIRMLDGEGYPHAFLETENFRFEFSRAALKPGGEIIADVKVLPKGGAEL